MRVRSGIFESRWRMHRIALALFLVALAGCTSDVSDLQAFVEAEKAKQPGAIEPLPQIKPYEGFVYRAHDLRAPFTPDTQGDRQQSDQMASNSGIQPDFNRNREYLETFPLDALLMVGTLEIRGSQFGLVRDPDGAIHRVQTENFLGQNHGKITEISEFDIKVTEIIPDGLGGWMERQAGLGLAE
ncbi:MAG: pilus assembly protein PilP [Gammaproteobacteria bacterium]|nr:pilus assembly protein PilP [Gammaproteobacteria bacterium]